MNDYWYVYTFSLLHNDGGYNKLSGQSSNLVDSCIQGWNPIPPQYESAIVHSTGLNQNLPTLMKTTKKFGLLFIYVHIHRYTFAIAMAFQTHIFFSLGINGQSPIHFNKFRQIWLCVLIQG